MKATEISQLKLSGIVDENIELPEKDGIYFCFASFKSVYSPATIEFKNGKFQITDSCEHIFWIKIEQTK